MSIRHAAGFSLRLSLSRHVKGLGLRECARAVGMSPSYLSRIENGLMLPPSEEILVKLAGVLGDNPDKMIFDAGRIPSDVLSIVHDRGVVAAELLRLFDGMTSEDRVKFLASGRRFHRRGGGYDARDR